LLRIEVVVTTPRNFNVGIRWRSFPRGAAYDLKKLRAKNIVGQTRRYESTSSGLKAMVALVVLRNKAIKPLLAAAQRRRKSRGAQNPRPIDKHYEFLD
jgi:hypothetical protein